MKLGEILRNDLIIDDLECGSKDEVLHRLADRMGQCEHIDADQLYEVFAQREQLGSTGIEDGVAIPHGKIPGIKDMVACFARSKKGIEFASRDGKPTHLVVALLAPEDSAGKHLKALARVSRLLKQEKVRQRLLDAKDCSEIYEIIDEEEKRF